MTANKYNTIKGDFLFWFLLTTVTSHSPILTADSSGTNSNTMAVSDNSEGRIAADMSSSTIVRRDIAGDIRSSTIARRDIASDTNNGKIVKRDIANDIRSNGTTVKRDIDKASSGLHSDGKRTDMHKEGDTHKEGEEDERRVKELLVREGRGVDEEDIAEPLSNEDEHQANNIDSSKNQQTGNRLMGNQLHATFSFQFYSPYLFQIHKRPRTYHTIRLPPFQAKYHRHHKRRNNKRGKSKTTTEEEDIHTKIKEHFEEMNKNAIKVVTKVVAEVLVEEVVVTSQDGNTVTALSSGRRLSQPTWRVNVVVAIGVIIWTLGTIR